jgi:formylglycine-generating enzyme required for sulfatase activity
MDAATSRNENITMAKTMLSSPRMAHATALVFPDLPSCCCRPATPPGESVPARPAHAISSSRATELREESIPIPGGRAEVGTDRPRTRTDGEGPRRFVKIKPFRIGATAVTNAQFAVFIEDTAYITEAERFGWSYVFGAHIQGVEETRGVVGAEWWRRVDGCFWRTPLGPTSSLDGREDYPVVHISWNDAAAYAAWAGGRLPTEAEWEHAARGGLTGSIYPWGDRHPNDFDFTPCNIWQGDFPLRDTALDGYAGLAPARSFEPNGYGLYNMCGNCWEWTSEPFRVRSLQAYSKSINERATQADFKLAKGGSHLCHASYCHRYRIAARTGNTPDSTTSHIGFRIVFDV